MNLGNMSIPYLKNFYFKLRNNCSSQVPVTHTCNSSYSGSRDQEDHSLKPAQGNSSVRSYLEKSLHKNRAGGVAQGVGPEEFRPQ
jgi:hypothetical protein